MRPSAPLRRARALLALLLAAAAGPARAQQSSFDTDPFASRFRERAAFELKFKVPEKGGLVKISVPEGSGGRLSVVGEETGEAVAPEGQNVLVEYQDVRLTARRVRVDHARRVVVAEGDVTLEQGASRLRGDRLDLDLTTRTGVVLNGSADLEGGLHLRGAILAKVGPRSFTLEGATLTSCEGDRPAWSFGFKRGRVTVDDYARLTSVVFRMGGVPLLYTPYILWPALTERASGFLIPAVGFSSSRGGYLGVSYFWAISRSADATFLGEFYTHGAGALGAEVRLAPSKGTRLEAIGAVARDPDVSDGWEWKTAGRIVSDDLAKGLRGVVTWLHYSDIDFFQSYDRDFFLTSARSTKSEGFLTWIGDPVALNLRVDREEAFYGADTVVTERRPVLEARLRPTPLFGQRLFVEAEGSAGLLSSEKPAGQPSGSWDRLDLFPKLSAPLSPLPWLSLDAEAGVRLTRYGESVSEDRSSLVEDPYTRTVFTAGAGLVGPSFARVFETSLGSFTKLKHVIEPRLDYRYTDGPDDTWRAPAFDQVDFVTPEHSLRYALVQRLLGKPKNGFPREVASLEIARIAYLDTTGTTGSAQARRTPWEATLRVNTGPSLSFDARSSYDPEARQVTSASLSANLSLGTRSLSLSLFDSKPVGAPSSSAQVRLTGGTPILRNRLRLDLQGAYDISQSDLLEIRGLLTVEASCFKILVEYRDLRVGVAPSRDVRVGLSLKNVGSFLDFPVSLP